MNLSSLIKLVLGTLFSKIIFHKHSSFSSSIIFLFLLIPFLLQAQISASDIQEKIEASEELRLNGQLPEAINLLENTLAEVQQSDNSVQAAIGELYHKLGVNHYRMGTLGAALENTQKALEIRNQLEEKNQAQIARGYFLLGAIQRGMGELSDAKNSVNSAINTMESSLQEQPNEADSLRLANMYVEFTRNNWTLGDFSTAHLYLNKALSFFQNKYGDQHYEVAGLYKLRGIIWDEEKKHQDAQNEFLKAIEIYQQLGDNLEPDLASTYTNLALSHFNSKNSKLAKKYFDRALKLYEQAYKKSNFPYFLEEMANVNACLLRLYGELKNENEVTVNFEEGLINLNRAINSPYHPLIAEIYRHKGAADILLGAEGEALKNFQTATKSLLPNYNPDDVLQSPRIAGQTIANKRELLEILRLKSKALLQAYGRGKDIENLKAAYEVTLVTDTLITQMRQGFSGAGSRYTLMDKVLPVYGRGIDIALQLFENTGNQSFLDAAYHFSAKNKAMILLEGLQDEEAKQFGGIPSALLDQERQLKKTNYELSTQIYELQQKNKPESLQNLKDSLFSVQRAYTQLINQFEIQYPNYFKLKYQYSTPVNISEIQQSLSSDAALLEYFVGEKHIYLFTIGPNSFDYHRIEKPDNFTRSCLDFRKASDGRTPLAKQAYLELGYQIYTLLLEDALQALEAKQQLKRLMIIPDDILLLISFDPLLYEKTETWDRLNNPYLLQKYAISYAYSNRLLFDNEKADKINRSIQGFGGFGLEYDDYTLEGIEKLIKTKVDSETIERATGKLIYSDDEVMEIAELLEGKSWINQEATKEAFLEHANDFQILHMAMHGVVNERSPLNSALIFTRTSDTADYFLRAADLYGLELNADLAVLSACNTGYGTINRGEGVRSLARAFAYSGCPSLIASLWEASDKSSKDILIPFYENLKEGLPKDLALQQAKLKYLENAAPAFSSPAYWSHLALIGDAEEVKFKTGLPLGWIALILSIAGLIALLLVKRART